MARQPRLRGRGGDDSAVLRLPSFALSTADLYPGAQPGGYHYGLPTTNPVATDVLYAGDPANYGTAQDPMVGEMLGGTVVFGGRLPLYPERIVRLMVPQMPSSALGC